MTRFWQFDDNSCEFIAVGKQAAFQSDHIAVVNDGDDVCLIIDHEVKRWSSGDPLCVAGVEFAREQFE